MELTAVAALLAGYDAPWWIAGGWAIDLFAGGNLREHEDVDVVVLRHDQEQLAVLLAGWDVQVAVRPGELVPWRGERLEPPVHELHARRASGEPWACEFLLDDVDGGRWVFRRDPRVTRPLDEVGVERSGLPVLAPEIALLFKATSLSTKDVADFEAVAPRLDERRRGWLARALEIAQPGHPWLERL